MYIIGNVREKLKKRIIINASEILQGMNILYIFKSSYYLDYIEIKILQDINLGNNDLVFYINNDNIIELSDLCLSGQSFYAFVNKNIVARDELRYYWNGNILTNGSLEIIA